MIAIGTRAHGDTRRRPIPVLNDTFFKAEWLETPENPTLSPTAFLVEQPPNTTLVPHFHKNNQFQLFVDGSGTIGRHPIGPVTVHYAGAFTGYGPLVSGSNGIKYFTMRPVCESGMHTVEHHRADLKPGPRRHASSAPFTTLGSQLLSGLTRVQEHVLLELAEDGLGSIAYSLPPGEILHSTCQPICAGQFLTVVSGSLQMEGQVLKKWEPVFLTPDETSTIMQGGAGGAQVISMHVPPMDPAFQ